MRLDLSWAAFWIMIAILGATGSCEWSRQSPKNRASAALEARLNAEAARVKAQETADGREKTQKAQGNGNGKGVSDGD